MTVDGTTMGLRRRQAAADQVRVAYGAVPAILEGLSPDHPVRAALRDRARFFLIECGYLTAEELGRLPVKDALAVVRRRLRDEFTRPEPVRGVSRSAKRLVSGPPQSAAVALTDQTTRV